MTIKTKYEIGQRVWIVYRHKREVCVYDDYIIEICIGKDELCYMLKDCCDEVAEEDVILYDETDKLKPFYEYYQKQYHCLFQKDIYTNQQWLEIMPQGTSKAHAIEQLKHIYHYDRLVVFGDGENDIEMFQLADEAYTVDNAHEKLKAIATQIIPSNDQDGVAQFLKQTWKNKELSSLILDK